VVNPVSIVDQFRRESITRIRLIFNLVYGYSASFSFL